MSPALVAEDKRVMIPREIYGIIERYGSGIKRIKSDCDKNGRK